MSCVNIKHFPKSHFVQRSTCDVCQRTNHKMTIQTPELHPVPVKSPWLHVAIDFIGPITPTSQRGNRYILTLSDYFTKFAEAIPLPTKCAKGVVNVLFKLQVLYTACFNIYCGNILLCFIHHSSRFSCA